MARTMSLLMQLGPDTPTSTSAPFMASASVPVSFRRLVIFASSCCAGLNRVSPSTRMPTRSQTVISCTPKAIRNFDMAIPAAPAPLTTTRISSIFFPASFSAFSSAAAVTMAVPC